MAFAVALGNGITLGLEDDATYRGKRYRKEDNRRGVVGNNSVHPSDRARRSEVIRQAEYKLKIESSCCQDEKACEYKQMQRASKAVARMLPLSEPELHDPLNTQPWPVEPEIALRMNHRRYALVYDVCETREADDLNQEG